MPVIVDLRKDIEEYLRKYSLCKKWEKAKKAF